jgi:cyclohexanone monooxygenase
VRQAGLRQAQAVEPPAEGEAGWCAAIRTMALDNLKFRQDCTPGYYNGEGRAGAGEGLFDNLYGPGSDAFFALLSQWREAGTMEGLELR